MRKHIRIIAKFILIILLILLMFSACKPKEADKPFDFEDYKNAYENVCPSKYIRITEIYSNETLLSKETKEHIKDKEAVYEKIVFEQVNVINPVMDMSIEEYYYKGNNLWKKAGEKWISGSGQLKSEAALRLNKKYFDEITITKTENGSELTAAVKEAMVAIFLQESSTFAQNVKIKLTEQERKLQKFVLSYDSKEYQIVITVNYSYTQFTIPVTLD